MKKVVVLAALAALLIVSSAFAAAPADEAEDVPRCHGRQAEIVGTDGDDATDADRDPLGTAAG